MDQLKKLYAALTRQQIIGIVVVALVSVAGLVSFVNWNHTRDFRPLFTGMAPEDASAVVAKLKESGVEHRLAENGTSVLVPSAKVDEVRLELAGAGLPRTGRVGFELFDRNNLGITDFTEHVNYLRALEGELERSVKAIHVIDQARVHLTLPKDSVFVDNREPAKASVLVNVRPGGRLTPQNVQAISNLVASAVEGLMPDAVSILDMQGNLLNRPKKHFNDDEPSEAILDYKHRVEKDLVNKVESTLDPLLGEGRFRVGISADCDFSTSEQSEEVLDPTKSAMVTSQKSEDVAGGSQSAGTPGTQSNLPRGTPGRTGVGVNSTRRTESTSFETSKLVRHTKLPQGSVKRISASILLDQEVRWEGKGKDRKRVLVPASPERIKAINDVIAGVIGLDTQRGDRLVIESLPFEQRVADLDAEPAAKSTDKVKSPFDDLMKDKRILIGAPSTVVVLIAAAFLFLRKRKKKNVAIQKALAEAEKAKAKEIAAIAAIEEETETQLKLPSAPKKLEQLRASVRETVRKDPHLAADVLRTWLEEPARTSQA